MGKRDITDRVTQAGDVEGHLKAYEWMMKNNRGCIIEEGGYGQRTTKATKASKKRDRDTKKANRRY